MRTEPEIVLLGCTQFPLVAHVFEKVFAETAGKIELLNPASFVAEEVTQEFDVGGEGNLHFVISKDSEQFRATASSFFQDGYTIEVL